MYERLWNPSLWEPTWRFSILIHPKWSSTGSGCNLVTSWWWPMGPSCKFLMGNVFIPNCWKRQVGMVGTLKNYCSSTIYMCIDILLYYIITCIYIYTYHNRLLMVYPCNWWWTCYWETIFRGCRCGTGWKLSQSSLSWPMWPLPQQGWGPGDQYLSR